MSGALAFVDTETTGLSEARRPWEIAIIRREPDGTTEEWSAFVRVSLDSAEPDALRVGRYADRFDHAEAITPRQAAGIVHELTAGAVLVGSNVQFDAHTLGRLLRAHGIMPAWHYRPLCVATLAAGLLASSGGTWGDGHRLDVHTGRFSSYRVSRALGVEPPAADVAHTAMGDAEWTMRLFDRITGEGDEL